MAILKPKKPADDRKSYRPISLLCVPLKVLKRLLLTRLEPIIDLSLPTTQAGFRSGRSTIDQITHLTDDIESGFEERKKAGLVLVDLTAAYDKVWHSGLPLKMLHVIPDHHMVRFLQELISNRRFTLQTRLVLVDLTAAYDKVWLSGLPLKMLHVIPDHHMVRFLQELISNRRFTLQTSDGRLSRPRSLKNGVPQGSTLSPLLFNIYISDLPHTQSQQYGYANDLALLYVDKDWNKIEKTLESDMMNISAYVDQWRLKLSTVKTTTTAFHLNSREANRELNISVNGLLLP